MKNIKKHNGDLIITTENQGKYRNLKEVSGSIYVRQNATLDAPNLKEVSGYIDVRQNATLDAPNLETSGSIDVRQNATLDAPNLNIKNGMAKFRSKQYKVLLNDGITFLSESERTSKGIRIYKGLTEIHIENKKVVGKTTYLVEKEGFSSHGTTLKKAIGDLLFKIVSEKLKNEPINEDTEITVKHYRLITGACDFGCRDFMERNGIPYEVVDDNTVEKKPILAKELLPMLEKLDSYGLQRFKELATF